MKALEKALTGLTVLAAIAYSLGWLKTLSYFETFGIELPSVDLTIQDYLFESWFVVENVLFFVIFCWVLQASCRLDLANNLSKGVRFILLVAAGGAYLMLPYKTDAAFEHVNRCGQVSYVYSHYYSWLKFAPLVAYLLLVLATMGVLHSQLGAWAGVWPKLWPKLEDLFRLRLRARIRVGNHLLIGFIVVALGWSISLAKHVGAIDGKDRLLCPANYFPEVVFHLSPSSPADLKKVLEPEKPEAAPLLYVVHESKTKYFAWNATDFIFGEGQKARILVIPRENVAWVDAYRKVQVKPGALFF